MSTTEHPLAVTEAFRLFLNDVVLETTIGQVKAKATLGRDVYNEVANIILDAGLLFMCYEEEAKVLWEKIRAKDVIVEWLINTTVRWRALSFPNRVAYTTWLTHLSDAYSVCTGEDSVIDDGVLDQLPISHEALTLFQNNPWLAYLATLAISSESVMRVGIEIGVKQHDTTSSV